MPSRIVRPTLLLLLGLILAAGAWHVARLDRELDVRSAAQAATAATFTRARAAMLDLRAVERAYTAPGQDTAYWRGRAARDLDVLADVAADLDDAATTPAVRTAAANVRAAVTAARRLDGRMGDLAGTGLRDHAHDLLYGDAINASVALERELGLAEAALAAAGDPGSAVAVRQQQAVVVGAAMGAVLLVAWILARRSRADAIAEADALDAARRADADAAAAAAEAVASAAAPRLGERAASPAALQAAADVCGALARVQQPLELAGLVERMHGVLDSRGTIVWIFDAAADALRPGLSAGYASTAIGRMGTIPLSSDTPVAHAFTRGDARTVRGTADAPGALVVPIVTAGGVAGVITIELPPGNDRQPATLALTRIFAAQLAGLLAVTPRPADVDGPEIVLAGAAATRAAATASDGRERAAGRFADLT
jgi:hypothetical protein